MSLARPCLRLRRPRAHHCRFRRAPQLLAGSLQCRHASLRSRLTALISSRGDAKADGPKEEGGDGDALVEDYRQRIATRKKEKAAAGGGKTQTLTRGALAPSSIFNTAAPALARRSTPSPDGTEQQQPLRVERNPETMASKLDPEPHRRRRWERRKTIQAIQRRGRVSKAIRIKRTEREALLRSVFWKTSMKKLSPLARQIAGKPIEEAMVQMEFSKKKNAKLIRAHLEVARNKAIAERGMGLGKVNGSTGKPLVIRLKDGTKHSVRDRTGIYIDQAWVGKGSYGADSFPRARGRVDRLRLPQTSISVLLKEEATRVRLHEERVEKEKNAKPWVHLPDKPITGQRPYYSW